LNEKGVYMRFIKENPALAAGIGLPVLLIIFFSLATIIPQWFVEPPEYDLLFTVNERKCNENSVDVRLKIIDEKIKAEYLYPKKENDCYYNKKIYLFSAKNLTSQEIPYEIPAKDAIIIYWKQFDIAKISSLKLQDQTIAKDGYEFRNRNCYSGGGFFPFFGESNYMNSVAIAKNGRNVRVFPITNDRYYSYYNIEFLGWIIPDGEQK
jgi:hypothetical protein